MLRIEIHLHNLDLNVVLFSLKKKTSLRKKRKTPMAELNHGGNGGGWGGWGNNHFSLIYMFKKNDEVILKKLPCAVSSLFCVNLPGFTQMMGVLSPFTMIFKTNKIQR